MHGLSLAVTSVGYSPVVVRSFSLCGFSCCGVWALGTQASVAAARRLWSSGSVVVARGMWDLPGAGIEPVSPALVGGFLSTVPPKKSVGAFLKPIL